MGKLFHYGLASGKIPWTLSFLSLLILLVSFTVGYMFGGQLSEPLIETLKELYGETFNLPLPLLTILIFVNNFVKSFAAMLLGVVLGIPPLLFIFTNGLVLGIIGYAIIRDYGVWFFLAGILPHGVLEIPAVILSVALGVKLGLAVLGKFRHREVSVKETLLSCIRSYLFVVLPLLAIAAFIESHITPLILRLVS